LAKEVFLWSLVVIKNGYFAFFLEPFNKRLMKTNQLLLLMLFFGCWSSSNAQNFPFVLGGDVNFLIQNNTYPFNSAPVGSFGGIYSNSTDEIRNTNFSIAPYFGRDLNDNWLVGVNLGYRGGRYTADDAVIFGQAGAVDIEQTSNRFSFGFFARYRINPENKFNPYLQPFVGYSIQTDQDFQDGNLMQEERFNFLEAGVGAGVLYQISDKWRALLRLGSFSYVNGNWEIVDTDTEKNFSALGLNLNATTIRFGVEVSL
jgi:hypothetical protein